MTWPIVTELDVGSPFRPGACSACGMRIGEPHDTECVRVPLMSGNEAPRRVVIRRVDYHIAERRCSCCYDLVTAGAVVHREGPAAFDPSKHPHVVFCATCIRRLWDVVRPGPACHPDPYAPVEDDEPSVGDLKEGAE
jgi:hypothetical protein